MLGSWHFHDLEGEELVCNVWKQGTVRSLRCASVHKNESNHLTPHVYEYFHVCAQYYICGHL